jgi:GTPase Era involved in 16S rRNA processing
MRILCDGVVGGVPLHFSVPSTDRKLSNPSHRLHPRSEDESNQQPLSHNDEELEEKPRWNKFSSVFMVSSRTGDGLNEVKDALFHMAKPLPWQYNSQVSTDQNPKDLVCQLVREKFLDRLGKEMPYLLDFVVTEWNWINGKYLNPILKGTFRQI